MSESQASVERSAIISTCGQYRYELRRVWDKARPPFVSGMLNPSTADACVDDRTIVANCKRAKAQGCGSLIVWNLGAGRSTKPTNWKKMADPIGPENDEHIVRILEECKSRHGIAFVGWGNHGSFLDRATHVISVASTIGLDFYCLGMTLSGHPKHPLYIADAVPLVKWQASDRSF